MFSTVTVTVLSATPVSLVSCSVASQVPMYVIALRAPYWSAHTPTLNVQWNEAGEAGLARGGYHFFHPLKDPKRQAEIVVDIVDRLGVGEMPIALDFEGYDGISGVKGNAIVDPAIECMYELERLTGTIPVLYTGPSFWKYRLLPADHEDELKIYPLWELSLIHISEPTRPY